MEFEVSREVFTRVIMGYMREQKQFNSLCMLIAESGVGEIEMCSEMLEIQKFIIHGRWDDLFRYIEPLRPHCQDYHKVECIVKKQQYLEALSWQGAWDSPPELLPWRPMRKIASRADQGGDDDEDIEEVDMDQVVAVLKSLEPLCTQQEFNQLCNCLTYSNLADSPDFGNWRMAKGRLECISSLNVLLKPCLQDVTSPIQTEGSSLLGIIALGLEYCVEQAASHHGGGNRGRRNFYEKLPPRVPVSLSAPSQGHTDGDALASDIQAVMYPDVPGVLSALEALPVLHVSDIRPVAISSTSSPQHNTLQLSSPARSREREIASTTNVLDQKKHAIVDEVTPKHLTGSPVRISEHDVNAHDNTKYKTNENNHHKVHPKPPLSWTVDQSDCQNAEIEKPVQEKGKAMKGQSWNIDFDGSDDRVNRRNSRFSPRKSDRTEVRDHGEKQPSQQSTRPKGPRNDDDTVTVHSTSSQKTGLMSEDTVDKKSSKKSGAGLSSPVRNPRPESHMTRSRPHTNVFPGWASALDAATNQAVIINPVLLFRDSNPLRSVTLRPSASKIVISPEDGLEDSLSLNPQSTGENLTFAVGSNSKTVTIVDLARPFDTVSIRHELQSVHRGSIYAADWSRDSRLLASGSNDKTIRIIRNIPMSDQESGGPDIACSTLKGHTGTVRCLKFCPFAGPTSPGVLASGGAGDCRLRIWDVQSETCTTMAAHQDHIHGVSWIDTELVMSGCDKGLLLAHDTRSATVAWGITISSQGICHIGNICNNLVLCGHTNGEVNIFDVRTKRRLMSHVLHNGDVRSVAMWTQSPYPDPSVDVAGSHIFGLTTSFDGQGSVWKMNPNQFSSDNSTVEGYDVVKVARLVGHTDKILSSVYSPLTHDIITSGADGNVLCWSATNIAPSGDNA